MKNTIYFMLLAAVMVLASCNPKSSEQAENLNTTDSLPKGVEDITLLIMQDSSNASLFVDRAMIYLSEKEHNLAMRDMITAIQMDPGNTSYLLGLSDIYMSMGLLDNCLETLHKILEVEPENVESILKIAEINLILKKYKEAIAFADKAIAIQKSNPLPEFIKGYTYAEAGDTVGAIQCYLEAVSKDQSYYDAYIQLGLIYSVAGNRLAIDYFNNALNIDPQSIEAFYALAMFYQEADDHENAIATYNKLLLIDPQNIYALYNLGYVYLVLLRNYEDAIGYFDQVLAMQPAYFEALYNKGYCYELLGDYATAREIYKAVLEIETNYEKAIAGLNRVYEK